MELKNILDILGLEDAKDIESFKERFGAKFITRDEAHTDDDIKSKITGKITGAMTTLLKRELNLDSTEIKDKKWEDVFTHGVTKLKETIKEYEGKRGQSNDEALKDLQNKLEVSSKSYNELKEQRDALQRSFEESETGWSGKYRDLKINHLYETEKAKLSTRLRDMTDIEKRGFDSVLSANIKIDLDDNNEVIVKGVDGKKIPNPNRAGVYLSLGEALELYATKENLIKKNDGGRVVQNMFHSAQQSTATQDAQQSGRKIHPNALKNAQALRGK